MHRSEAAHARNEEIEVLRAVAVIFVLIHHYDALVIGYQWTLPRAFWMGVDIFLCISGYVIARSLLPALAAKSGREFRREVGAFWIRRWYRITPAAWLWIGALMAVIGVSGLKHNSVFWYDTFAAAFDYANYHFYRCTVDAAKHCASHHLYWSLSLEEQFYLAIPLAVFVFRRHLVWVLVAVALGQMFIERHHWTGITGFFRTDAIVLGVLLAMASSQPAYARLEPTALRQPIGRIVPVLLLASIILVSYKRPVPFYMGVVAVLAALCVWLASYGKGYFLPDGILRRVAVKIGERSFSIYLGQIISFTIARWIVARIAPGDTADVTARPLLTLCVGLVTLALLVEASYRLVEVPWRRRGRVVAERFRSRGPERQLEVADANRAVLLAPREAKFD